MSPQTLSAIAGTIISLLFSYVPGFKTWYTPLSPTLKRLLMLAAVCLAAAGAFGLACAGWGDQLNLNLTCNPTGALGLLQSLIAALAANQATFLISPKPAGKGDPASRDRLSGHPLFEGELDQMKHASNMGHKPRLPRSVSQRYEKSKTRPHPDQNPASSEHEPHPVKISPVGKQDK
jgi:hypothetical protein